MNYLMILSLFAAAALAGEGKQVEAKKKDKAPVSSTVSKGLSYLLIDELSKNHAFDAGLGQGWQAYAATVRCYEPIGTGNPADKPYCEFSKFGK